MLNRDIEKLIKELENKVSELEIIQKRIFKKLDLF